MEFISSMAVVLVTGLFIVTFNMQAFEIPSPSMVKTLLIGDHVFVDRMTAAPRTTWGGPLLPYREIQHGDIIVFLSPIEPGLHVVKRIIGIPGDRIHLKDGVVYRNGKPREEKHAYPLSNLDEYAFNFPAVPPQYSPVRVNNAWAVTLPSVVQ